MMQLFAITGQAICAPSEAQNSSLRLSSKMPNLIEDRVRSVHENDVESIKSLVSAVLRLPHYVRLQDESLAIAEPRFASAHHKYIKGAHEGVTEDDLARLLNQLADDLNVSPVLRTNNHQVRVIRMKTLFDYPTFMGAGMTSNRTKVGDSISTRMSPLQAAHLGLTVIDHKVFDKSFQIEPAQWEENYANQKREHLKALSRAYREGKSIQSESGVRTSAQMQTNDVRAKLEHHIASKVSTMSLDDLANYHEAILAKLKV